MKIVFENIGSEIMSVHIPPFDLRKEELAKIYVPNFYKTGANLGYTFVKEFEKSLLNRESTMNFRLHHSLLFTKGRILNRHFRNFSKLTCSQYIAKKTDLCGKEIEKLCEKLRLVPNRKLKSLIVAEEKILEIAVAFYQSDFLYFDYYGVDANNYQIMTDIINTEISKGKSAIGVDRLEFMETTELYENIKRIIVEEKD